MNFDLTQDQRDFAEMLRAFFGERYGDKGLRAIVDGGKEYDPALWGAMTHELELPGLAIDDAYGGSGASIVELSLLLEEYGRALVSSPLVATSALAVPVIACTGTDDARSLWLPLLANGDITATWALLDAVGEPDLAGRDVCATRSEEGWTIDGRRRWVLDGAIADVVLTAAATPDGPALFLVDTTDAEGLSRTAGDSLDPTLLLADVSFDATPAQRLSGSGCADGLERAYALVSIALAALQLGCLSATLDMVVEYARSRVQFGRPIGGFQAIKHRCADVFIDTETTRWVVYHAAALAADEKTTTADLVESAHLTCVYSSSHSFRAVANLLQVLGGIGYTWEHPGHLYFKRATATARLLGSSRRRLDVLATTMDALPSPSPTLGNLT
ncbi:acyl-CoA dehydrogenase family protein [Rhodococcus sp. 2H158]